MLEVINDHRARADLPSMTLSDNGAAQMHAESSLEGCFRSHLDLNGLNSSMRYSLAGGYQANQVDVLSNEYCRQPEEGVRTGAGITGWVTDHVIDPRWRKVSIGLAWGLVQPCPSPHDIAPDTAVASSGEVATLLRLERIDDLRDLSPATMMVPAVTASEWNVAGRCLSVAADVRRILDTHGAGVYSVQLWARQGDSFMLFADHAIFLGLESMAGEAEHEAPRVAGVTPSKLFAESLLAPGNGRAQSTSHE